MNDPDEVLREGRVYHLINEQWLSYVCFFSSLLVILV